MVSGTKWPGGDPFLQRQNEPSLAVSSRNPLHLLAGANDYRTVDLPISDTIPGSLAGDAWLGVFKSFDGGLTWQSTLLPGYPQDQSSVGLASKLKAYSAAADPTVRAGTNGLFYYSGIAFNRGTNIGGVFVSTFLDSNQKENGDATQGRDTMPYLNTVVVDTGTSGQFLDKTWLAVDIPRSGAGTCTFSPFGAPQAFPAGNVYLVWSRFTGSTSTKIMFSRSLDCGKTWSNPIKLSESSSINQGTNVAIDPNSGTVYVAWRRFATSSQADAILVAKSTDFGNTFPSKNTAQVATIAPFDQPTTPTEFRTNALPSIAVSVDASNVSRVHVAWAQRDPATGNAQIVVATSPDGLSWGSPVPADTAPITDDFGHTFALGHQFMPQLTFAAGRLMLLYYDQRLDHTLGFHIPNNPFDADSQGRFYLVRRDQKAELLTNPQQVFTLQIDDSALTTRRHTIDLRVAEAVPGPSLAFSAVTVSSYRFGLRAFDDSGNPNIQTTGLDQLQTNPPNLPLFSQGTLPFLGDYIDIAGQAFKANGNGTWSFNTAFAGAPVFYAAWTDNRDVKPPLDGDWTHYTPPGGGVPSVLDPTQTTPLCVNGHEGMRNQNIYSSRISEGLLVGSPQDAKPLSATLQRAFVVTMQNFTAQDRTFMMTLAPQAGVQASFLQTSSLGLLSVTVPARSGAARPVFASSSNPAGSIAVNVAETPGLGSLGLSGTVVLNPEGSVSPLAQPDGTTANIGALEIYTPSFQVWNPANPNPFLNISNPSQALNISNLNISNSDPAILNISNLNISNLNISNLNISNPDPAVLNISNLNISNATAANLNISNLNISNLNISNTPVTDATYAVTNMGNTTHSYRVALFGNNPANVPIQLIVTKNSTTPVSVNCTLQSQPQSIAVANVDNAAVATTLSDAASPAIADGSATNATVAVAPGETVFVTLRAPVTPDQMVQLARGLTPVVTAHGTNTNGVTPDFAALLFITTGSANLPVAVVGTPYSATLQSSGGKSPITWTLLSGALPAGLTVSSDGAISGTPSGSGGFTFTVQAADASTPASETAKESLTLTVKARATTADPLSLSPSAVVASQGSVATFTVTDTEPTGAASAPSGTVAFSGGGVTGGTCTLAPTATPAQSSCSVTVTASTAGTYTISASYAGSSIHRPASASANLTVSAASTSATIAFSSGSVVVGQPTTVTVSVADTSPGATTVPTGTVTFSSSVSTDTFSPGRVCSLAASGAGAASCAVAVTASSASLHVIAASYAGVTGVLQASTATLTLEVSTRATATAVSVSANPLTAGLPGTVSITVADVGAAGAKSSPVGTVTLSSSAGGDVFSPAGSCALAAGPPGASSCAVAVAGSVVGGRTISASYSGSSAHSPSGSTASLTIKGNTTTTITSDFPAPSGLGQSVTVTFAVAPIAPAVGTPTGTVTVTDGLGSSCSAPLASGSGSCALVPATAGTVTLAATYPGDAGFFGSAGARLHTVLVFYNFNGFLSPMTTAGTFSSPSFSGTFNFGRGVPIKWQLTDSSGNFLTSLSTTQTLRAIFNTACSGAPAGTAIVLFSPTQGATGGSTFRYDASNNQFLFNWDTSSGVATGTGCYTLVLQLNDGSPAKATTIRLQ